MCCFGNNDCCLLSAVLMDARLPSPCVGSSGSICSRRSRKDSGKAVLGARKKVKDLSWDNVSHQKLGEVPP